jgi:hypothetical protein
MAAAGIDLSEMPTRQVLALWAQTLRELRDREVVRTFNNPIGDIAEALVALHYGGGRASFSQPSWDVWTASGELLQVKALRRTGAKTRRVEQAIRIPQVVVNELFAWREHVAGRVITVTKKLLGHPEVEKIDLSDELLDTPVESRPPPQATVRPGR